MDKYLILIAGPTAVGKTQLSLSIAEQYKTDVISCDSRQFYKENVSELQSLMLMNYRKLNTILFKI